MSESKDNSRAWRLLVSCADQQGLVYRITGVLYRYGCNVLRNHEFADTDADRFFMRTEFVGDIEVDALLKEARTILPPDAGIKLVRPHKPTIVVLASKEYHCLGDLLMRHHHGELDAAIAAVASNHPDLESLARRFEVPFVCVPAEGRSREAHEEAVHAAIGHHHADYLVLAKYMRVLSPAFVQRYPHRMINIHHSFLPAFAGGRPYHQAFERGVKVIGATAHFVTDELDAGPIIVQEVIPVDHSHSPLELARAGREAEKLALSKALRLVFEDRVILNGNRTVIFD